MSASLVGSEMCIRDRLRLTATQGQLQWHFTQSSKRESGRCDPVVYCKRCLLYTSDAADDM
eukprot:1975258-Alexandrium_andersonii.AAC.1